MSDNGIGSSARAWLWGILVGGAAGFTLGLITAPEEGRKVRRRLAYQLDHLGDRVSELLDEFLNADESGEARRDGDALVADAEEKAQQIRADIDNLLGEMREHRKTG
ncbi:MAG: YtxH domain-containing protein [Rhodothermales bacterium]|nr:YtxH domain-containing protein [Rhodothermales bacterium]MBO6778259.1 YtxH domain-containing protein [Rhodothermales bacterium]